MSRLNQEIRIKRGLSYGADSGIDARRQGGALRVVVQTKNESAPDASFGNGFNARFSVNSGISVMPNAPTSAGAATRPRRSPRPTPTCPAQAPKTRHTLRRRPRSRSEFRYRTCTASTGKIRLYQASSVPFQALSPCERAWAGRPH